MPGWLGNVQVMPESALDRMAECRGPADRHRPGERGVQPAVPGRADNPKLASDILTPRTMQYLISVDAEAWRTCGSDLVGFAEGTARPVRGRAHLRCAAAGPGRHPELRVEGRWWHREWIQSRSMTLLWIVLGLVVLLAVFVAVSYNRFVSQRNLVQESWRQIDVELKRRHDLIPNLVETVKGYATHEREVFDAVTRARAAGCVAGLVAGPAGPAGGCAGPGAGPAVRGRRGLPGPQGEHELPRAAARARPRPRTGSPLAGASTTPTCGR